MPIVRGKRIEVLFSAEQIARRNLELAVEIALRPFSDLLAVSILKGSFVFAADLIRAMHGAGLSPEVEFILVSSYGTGTVSRDDILDSGKTLRYTRDLMLGRGARSVAIAVLLDKRRSRQSGVEADFIGFECPDCFVAGYGMDFAHAFRELPFVGVVEDS